MTRRFLTVLAALLVIAGAGTLALALDDGTRDGKGPTEPDAPSPARTPSTTPEPSLPTPGWQSTAGAPTISPCPAPSRDRLTVVTLNLHFGRASDGRLDLEGVASELRAWRPDVVLLQEVDRNRFRSNRVDQAGRLGRLLGMEVALGVNRKVPPGGSGNAILSRLPIVSTANRSLPGRPDDIDRGLLRATLDLDGQRVDVFATHLESSSSASRRAQSRVVVGQVLRSPGPVVLGGDLNSVPGRSPGRRIARAGLVDAWEAAGRGEGHTVPAGSPGRRIDYVFADESFRVLSAEVLRSLVSDHRAVRAGLALLPRSCR